MAKHRYHWVGHDRTGKQISGHLEADHPDQARELLRLKRIRATRVRRYWAMPTWMNFKTNIQSRDMARFTRQ